MSPGTTLSKKRQLAWGPPADSEQTASYGLSKRCWCICSWLGRFVTRCFGARCMQLCQSSSGFFLLLLLLLLPPPPPSLFSFRLACVRVVSSLRLGWPFSPTCVGKVGRVLAGGCAWSLPLCRPWRFGCFACVCAAGAWPVLRLVLVGCVCVCVSCRVCAVLCPCCVAFGVVCVVFWVCVRGVGVGVCACVRRGLGALRRPLPPFFLVCSLSGPATRLRSRGTAEVM